MRRFRKVKHIKNYRASQSGKRAIGTVLEASSEEIDNTIISCKYHSGETNSSPKSDE